MPFVSASRINVARSLTVRADPDDPLRLTNETRKLGLVVARGTSVTVVAPTMGAEEIANPFVNSEGVE